MSLSETFERSRYWQNGDPPKIQLPRYRGGPALEPAMSGEQVPVLTALDRGGELIERMLQPLRNEAEIGAALNGRITAGG